MPNTTAHHHDGKGRSSLLAAALAAASLAALIAPRLASADTPMPAPAEPAPVAPVPVPTASRDAPAKAGAESTQHAVTAISPPAPPHAIRMSHGRFENFLVYQPAGTPKNVVLFLSGDAGWTAALDAVAQRLVAQGSMVAALDYPGLRNNLDADGGGCVFPDGDLENLSHFVQAYFHVPTYLVPLLAGASSGATMAYAALVQAPVDTFAAAATIGFCPQLDLRKPLCAGSGIESTPLPGKGTEFHAAKKLDNPWVNLSVPRAASCDAATARSFLARIPGAATVELTGIGADLAPVERLIPPFDAALQVLASRNPAAVTAPPPSELTGLPLIDVPAAVGLPSSDEFALILSGDGGWAGLDKDVASALTAKGIPVIGLDSLRYFWTPRTPDGLASDLDRIIRYYLAHLGKKRVLLIGYSQGADVLPFAVNRLTPATRAHVASTTIMGMSEHALFEFHVSSWIADSNEGPATLPEVDKLHGMPVLCIYGDQEDDTLCPKLDPKKISVVKLKGGHHFDGDYAGLARVILTTATP